MRTALSPPVLAVALACASAPPLRPADPGQRVAGEPHSATASAQGVRLTARPGAPSGWDVDERLMAVEVAIDNRSGRTLDVRPERFALTLPDGTRHVALAPEEERPHGLSPAWGLQPASAAPPAAALAPEALASGDAAELLLLFATSAAALERFELEVTLVDRAGGRLGTIRVPFERRRPGPGPEWIPLPPIARAEARAPAR